MNKNDKQIFDILEKELKGSVENVKVPLRLQKESIVKMLENANTKETDFSVETGNIANSGGENEQKNSRIKIAAFQNESTDADNVLPEADGTAVISNKNNIIIMRKMAAIAAMLAVVISGVLIMKPSDGIKVVRADSFYEEHKGETPIKKVQSIKEFEKIVEVIRNDGNPQKENTPDVQPTQAANPQNKPNVTEVQKEPAKPGDAASVIGSYSGFIASSKLENKENSGSNPVGAFIQDEPVGIATYGDYKADIVKTDGKYLYIASNGTNSETGDKIEQIRIVKTSENGTMEDVSTIVLFEGSVNSSYDECIEIHLRNNRLTAIIKRHNYSFSQRGEMSDNASTLAVYYDITNPYAPVKIREHLQDGEYISSNLYEGKLCLVTAKSISYSTQDESSLLPSFSVDGVKVNLSEDDIHYAPNDPEKSYLFVTVTDADDFTKGVGRLVFLGTGTEIYCTPSAIFAARKFVSVESDENGIRNTMTEIYRINISGSSLEFSESYILKGSLIGGVSVDDESGYLNVFATDSSSNRLYVLDDKMNFVIALEIFNGEKVTGVNFFGNNCYVMVEGADGEKTVIIDCSDPSSPEVAETISQKAFSDELYEISDTQLLGIKDSQIEVIREENGEDIIVSPITITLFNVSDPKNPAIASDYPLDESFKSVAATDSRSVMIDTEKNLLGIPVMKTDKETGANSSSYAVFDVSENNLVPVGIYTHSNIGDAAVRSICIGDTLYTVSGDKIVSFDISKNAPADTKKAEFPLN